MNGEKIAREIKKDKYKSGFLNQYLFSFTNTGKRAIPIAGKIADIFDNIAIPKHTPPK